MNPELRGWTAPHLSRIEAALAEVCPDADPTFREALLYPLRTGGKRIRPLLACAAAESVGGSVEQVIGAAVALELIHTYSLVHDDLPAMDNDDERRGRPTVHIVHGEAAAILVGDALLTAAFEHVAHSPTLVRELARAAGAAGMVGGQYLDIYGKPSNIEALTHLHRLKTGALLRASVRMGGLAAGADEEQLLALTRFGAAVGLAFQVADDVLDADQDAGEDGPPSFVRLLGLERTRAEAQKLAAEAIVAARELPNPSALIGLAHFAVDRTL